MLNNLKLQHLQVASSTKNIILDKQQFQFYVISFGSCSFHIEGNANELTSISANKGDFILLPANSIIVQMIQPGSICESYSFEFIAFNSLVNQLPLLMENSILKYTSGLYERTLDRLRPIWLDEQERLAYNQIRIGSLLLDTLAIWQRELDRGELSPASHNQVARMKTYIRDHYREKVTKEVLGDYIRRTPSYAATLFKKGTGQTISEYVHAVRLKTGHYMLTNSLLNVTEIAEHLGYSDVSYFQRLFKRTYGKTATDIIATRERI